MPEEQEEIKTGPPKELKQISETVWELPASFKPGMRVPARVIGTKGIIDAMDGGVYDQISNVATLPGIQKYALCMPDGHWGYGFPIGGVAAFDAEHGVISPGGIGFDINCLVRGTNILTENGYFKPIQDFESDFVDTNIEHQDYMLKSKKFVQSLVSFDIDHKLFSSKEIQFFMKKKHYGSILQIKTRLGYKLDVTDDHPVLTDKGMIKAGKISKGDKVAVYPFDGVSYEELQDSFLVSDETFFTKQERNELIKRDLFPLNIKNSRLPIIAKLFGYLLGDGQIYISGEKGFVCAYGQEEDLKDMQKDFEKLGFSARIYGRKRDHFIPTKYGNVEFTSTNYELHVSSKALTKLFFSLGYPKGIKTSVPFLVPDWIMESPLWVRRLFLSGLFGAELSKPSTHTKTGFYCPTLQMNKNMQFLENGRKFFIQIISLLEEFKIRTHKLTDFEDFKNKQGKTNTIRLLISADEDNLIKLFSNIGFSYNKKREILSHIAILYIKEKKLLTKIREEATLKIKEFRKQGLKLKEIQDLLELPFINRRFIQRHYYENVGHRITLDFVSFNEFVELKNKELEKYGCLFDTVESITKRQYDDEVYDFNIPYTHNFIANNVVVSNCGMRLVLTNLTYKDVKPKLKELVDRLFHKVPAGVGSKGFVKLKPNEFREVIELGAKWCVSNGYGWEEDLERTEEFGCMEGADNKKVSDKAVSRGLEQIGTLGSGNHYLEIQRVLEENIFDKEIAKKWGIFPDQIVVMFHCGSRGFGHQVATDYLKIFLEVMESKYGIKILDRELACAPFNSPEGQDYFSAMKCGINMSFANRQVILHRIREVFSEVFKQSPESLGLRQVYDVAHNTAKVEEYKIDGRAKKLIVHRKGATRSFGPGRDELPLVYRDTGQPVIIGGSMETGSYLLVGTKKAEEETFGSTAHGSGRTMSRNKAKRLWRGDQLQKDMEARGIYVKTMSFPGLAEESGGAYKDIHEIAEATEKAGISRRVAALLPIGNVKG